MTTTQPTRSHLVALSICSEIEELTPDTVEEWLEDALDIEVTFSSHGVRDVAVLLMYGGPTARVRWNNSDLLEVHVEEMSGEAVQFAVSSTLADALADIALRSSK